MPHDRVLRRVFPLVVGLAIAIAAYLQVVGLRHLVETTLRARPRVPPSRIAAPRTAASVPLVRLADATPILERNPFDSVTGRLQERIVEHGAFHGVAMRDTGPCEGARVVIIAASSDGWSFAALAGPDGNLQLRRDRQVLDGFLEDPQGASGRVRFVPEVGGVRLLGIRADSRLTLLGLQNGDRLETMNGMPLRTPEDALQAYAHLRNAERLQLTIARAGKKQQLDYRIR
jgi:hypothetical protein